MRLGVNAWWRVVTMTVVAAALVSMVALSPAFAATKRPACTKKAVAAGLRRGPHKIPGAKIDRVVCAGRFAVGLVVVDRVAITVLFRASGARWFSIDRTKPCEDRSVPKKLYAAACMTN